MAKIKLVQAERMFVTTVKWPTDEGMVENRALDPSEQVKCEITIATIEQKSKYIGSYSTTKAGKKAKNEEVKSYVDFKYKDCIEKHCGKVTGLEDFGVTSGTLLYKQASLYPILNEMVQDVFFKINGIHEDDTSGDSDSGELTEGED